MAAGIFFVALAIRFRSLLDKLFWYSDAAFLPLLVEDLAARPRDGIVNLGNTPHYTSLWLLNLTQGLPFHRQIWSVTPYLFYLASLALIAWTIYRLAGRRASLLSFAVGVAAGPLVLFTVLPQGFRSHTWFADAVLVWFLVSCSQPGSRKRPFLWCAGLGIMAGAVLASDPLFVLSGLVPFIGAAGFNLVKERSPGARRLWWMVLGTTATAGLIAPVISYIMHSLGYRATFPDRLPDFVTPSAVSRNLGTLTENLLGFGNGFVKSPITAGSIDELAGVVLAILGLAVPFIAWRRSVKAKSGGANNGEQNQLGLLPFVSFWLLTQVGLSLGFLATTVSFDTGLASSRYLTPVFFASMATLGIWASGSRGRRSLASVGATLFCFLSLLSQHNLPVSGGSLPSQAPRVMDFLSAQGITRGYAGYWSSHAFSWQTGMNSMAYPVWQCPSAKDRTVCPFPLAVRSAWYEPGPDRKTFLLVDPAVPLALKSPHESQFGPAESVNKFGPITLYVFNYDIASRLAKPEPPFL